MAIRPVKQEDIVVGKELLMSKDNVMVRISGKYESSNPRVGYLTSCDGFSLWRWTGVHELIFFLNNEFGGIIV